MNPTTAIITGARPAGRVRRGLRFAGFGLLLGLSLNVLGGSVVTAQEDLKSLQRDQEEILRKSERLRDLMVKLMQRYEREGRVEQVNLLRSGLEHLKQSAMVEDVAGIRENLASEALAEALRKQVEVVTELERLLAILMDRRSVENLEKEIEAAAKLARDARAVLDQQTRLQQETRDAARGEPTPAERETLAAMRELAQRERAEAQQNQRAAGTRVPTLEDALQRTRQLVERQRQLEQRARDEQRGQVDPGIREQSFRIGELEQGLRELAADRERERDLADIDRGAQALQKAAAADDAARKRAREQLESQLAEAARRAAARGDGEAAHELEALQKELAEAAEGRDQQRQEQAAAEKARAAAAKRREQLEKNDAAAQQALTAKLEQAAKDLKPQTPDAKPPAPDSAAAALERARAAFAASQQRRSEGQQAESLAREAEAARELAEAQLRFQREHPDAARMAREMSSGASQVARDLRSLPPQDDAGASQPEQNATEALEQAEQQLRELADRSNPEAKPEPGKLDADLAKSREQLQRAQSELERALGRNTAGREQEMREAASRQAQARQQAEELKRKVEAQKASGALQPKQADAATEALEQASASMQEAQQALEQGRQATGSERQRQAAEQLERGAAAVEKNRALTPEQREQMQKLAEKQKQIEQDILELAKLAEERKNRKAKNALDQAAEAAKQAQRAMNEGDADESEQEQQEAREQLQKAADELETERDRYLDLRQEELLFKLRDELTQMLEQQRALSQATKEAQASLTQGQAGRRLRKRLNDVGVKEKELAVKSEWIRTALLKEDSHVYPQALKETQDDLEEVARRLSGSEPDAGPYTTTVQSDLEERLGKLLEALKREQQERQQQQQQQQQQQPQDSKQREQRQRLVNIVAELKMLKQLEEDLQQRSVQIERLLAARGNEAPGTAERDLLDRLANRQNQITTIFLKLKQQLDDALRDPTEEQQPPRKEKR